MQIKLPILSIGLFILSALIGCTQKSDEALTSTRVPIPLCQDQPESAQPYSTSLGSSARRESQPAVAALAFSGEGRSLWIAYIHDLGSPGQIVQISMPDRKVLSTLELPSLNTFFTRFSGDGSLIGSVSRIQCPTRSGSSCVEPRLWRTNSGELISAPMAELTEVHDMALTKQGKWLVAVLGVGLSIIDPIESTRGLGIVHAGEGKAKIVAGVVNESGNLVAYGTDRKYIEIGEWDGRLLKDIHPWSLGPFNFQGANAETDAIPTKLSISPDNHWLAVRTAEWLELRDVSVRFLPQRGRASLEQGSDGVMEFNPSTSLLATGSQRGLRVLSIPTLEKVLDRPTSRVTAIAFSPDGCLLAWGDVEGTVHIINAPKP